jgi:hypothetical protein
MLLLEEMVKESIRNEVTAWSTTLQGVLGGAKASASAAKKDSEMLSAALGYLTSNDDFSATGTWSRGDDEPRKKRAFQTIDHVVVKVLDDQSIGTSLTANKRLKLMSVIGKKLNADTYIALESALLLRAWTTTTTKRTTPNDAAEGGIVISEASEPYILPHARCGERIMRTHSHTHT